MIQVTLFINNEDPLLYVIKNRLDQVQQEHPHELHIIDISEDAVLEEEYAEKAPVLDIGVFRLVKTFKEEEIRFAFTKAEERLQEARSKGNDVLVWRITEPLKMTKSDRASRWFSNHYMSLLNGFVFLYVFLAFFAPVLMKIGWEAPARVIYRVYSPLCHQLAYRSFFIFGEQTYYPRQLAGIDGVVEFREASGLSEYDLSAARHFLGNERMGFKTALCQRDIAIYSAILVFGIIFSLSGRKIKALPWYLWILIAVAPMGLDGFSQLLSQTGWAIFAWIPLRESTPLFRVVTGALFGLGSVWFGFPYLEESVKENRREMQMKYAIASQIEARKNQAS
jgi:uncharacterized membrane protein